MKHGRLKLREILPYFLRVNLRQSKSPIPFDMFGFSKLANSFNFNKYKYAVYA